MDREEAHRVLLLARGAVELGVSLALLPVKLVLRAVHPDREQDRWAPPAPAPAPAPPVARPAPAPHPAPQAPEPAAEARSGSLGAKLRVDPPWPDYDAQAVATIVARLRGADPALVAVVRLYEETHKNRVGILRATAGE